MKLIATQDHFKHDSTWEQIPPGLTSAIVHYKGARFILGRYDPGTKYFYCYMKMEVCRISARKAWPLECLARALSDWISRGCKVCAPK
jgi:hypothetical protein